MYTYVNVPLTEILSGISFIDMSENKQALERAIEICGGPTRLAQRLGVGTPAGTALVSGWKKRGLPHDQVLNVEKAVQEAIREMDLFLEQAKRDNINRYKLRPDLYPLDSAQAVNP